MDYVLYGTGWEAEKFYYSFQERKNIRYCIDGKRGGQFHGLPIYTIDNAPDTLFDYYILIAAAWASYLEIEKILEKKGLYFIEDFIWTKAINKKILLINANCHGSIYREYLHKFPDFQKEYCEFLLPSIAVNENGAISEGWLRNCDVYIHQDIQASNSKSYQLSDEYILPKLKQGCKKICVPNLVGLGRAFFPSSMGLQKNIQVAGSVLWMFVKDELIEEGYEKYHTISGIKKMWLAEDAIEQKEIQELFQDRLNRLYEREKNWDIKVSDIFLNSYKDKKLFCDDGHPANALMLPICARLGELLGLNTTKIKDIQIEHALDDVEAFVLPCVKKALGLNWTESITIRDGKSDINKLRNDALTVDEYIRQYIWWYKGEYLEE